MDREMQWLLDDKYEGDERAEGFGADVRRLEEGEPLAYVIGFQPFLGLRIHLDSLPLIPRPETEWWTEQLLHELADNAAPKTRPPATFLDLCAGSGAIGYAALARLPNALVYFGELDPSHEALIRKNIRENGLDETRAHVRIGDLFTPFGDLKFDVIACNPPYIPEKRGLPASVANYEPERALFAGPDGLSLIRRIAHELPMRLTPKGVAWIECDRAHAEAAKELFADLGMRAEIRTDQYAIPRIIVVSLA